MPKYRINVEKRINKDKLIVDAKRLGEKDRAAHMSDLYAMENRIQVAHIKDLNAMENRIQLAHTSDLIALENRINLKIDNSNADLKADLKQFIIANK